MFTADAKETDATAKKTAKTAVNGLNRLWPARLQVVFSTEQHSLDALHMDGWLVMMRAGQRVGWLLVAQAGLVAVFVFLLSR